MLTVLEIIKRTTEFFAAKGIESPRLNAELLIGHALDRKRMQLYLEFERPLMEAELEKIRPLVRRRAQHEPIQYILGETDFHGLKLKLDRRALIPRPETEQLIEQIVLSCPAPPARILDLGTGSGAIALALAKAYPQAVVVATDRSPEALTLARENASAAGVADRVSFVESDWYAALLEHEFDLIAANPPYLSAEEVAAAPVEVREFEPVSALASPEEGLSDLRRIIAGAPDHLAPGGMLALETGVAQHAALTDDLRRAGFQRIDCRRDLANRERFVFAFR